MMKMKKKIAAAAASIAVSMTANTALPDAAHAEQAPSGKAFYVCYARAPYGSSYTFFSDLFLAEWGSSSKLGARWNSAVRGSAVRNGRAVQTGACLSFQSREQAQRAVDGFGNERGAEFLSFS